MRGRLKDLTAIGALAFEYRARIVQAMAEHMQIGISPRHQLAVVPDDPLEPVIGLRSHCLLLQLVAHDLVRKPLHIPDQVEGMLFGIMRRALPAPSAAVMAHFLRRFQHFASQGNTRYD